VFRVSWGMMFLGWAVSAAVWAVWCVLCVSWWGLRHPRTSVAVAGCAEAVYVARRWGPLWLLLTVYLGGVVVAVWGTVHPASLRSRFRSWWRRWFLYQRQWTTAMDAAELVETDVKGEQRLPRLTRVRCIEGMDVLRVRAVLKQRPEQWREAAPMLAHVYRAAACRVRKGDDRRLTLEFVQPVRRGRSWGDTAPRPARRRWRWRWDWRWGWPWPWRWGWGAEPPPPPP
jgi:hypothetical protein